MGDYDINVNLNFIDAAQGAKALNDSLSQLSKAVEELKGLLSGTGISGGAGGAGGGGKRQTVFSYFAKDAQDAAAQIKEAREKINEQYRTLAEIQRTLPKGTNITTTKAYAPAMQTINDMKQKVRELKIQQADYNAVIDKTTGAVNKMTGSMSNAMKGMFSLKNIFNSLAGVMGTSLSFYGLFSAMKEAIKTIADFDLAQAKLRSILGETRKGMEEVSRSAIEIGKNSIFGAAGVTELQIELAKMGFAKSEILDMQQAIVNLATATQEDLAKSSEVVANILRAFQMNASQATRVVDIMGKAFNDSALDLANFREAIKYVAPVAHQANFTFEQTVALLEALSNAGIKGSLAGTGLTNILSRLGNENSKFVKTIGRTVEGYDDFIKAMIELKKRGTDLTEVFQLVDRRAAAAFSIILQGVDTVEQFNQKLRESEGVMAKQASVQLDTITNKTLLLKNAWDAFILSVDNGNGTFSKTLKSMIQQVTDLLNLVGILGDKEAEIEKERKRISENKLEDIIKRSPYTQQVKNSMLMDLSLTKDYYNKLAEIMKIGAEKVNAHKTPFQFFDNADQLIIKKNIKEASDELYKQFEGVLSRTKNIEGKLIEDLSDEQLNIFKKRVKEGESVLKVFDDMVYNGMMQYQKLVPIGTTARKIIDESINKIDVEYKKLVQNKELSEAEKKRMLELMKQYMELQKQIEAEKIKNAYTGFEQEIRLINSAYDWDKKIAEQTIEDRKTRDLTIELLNVKFLGNYGRAWRKESDEITKMMKKTMSDLIDWAAAVGKKTGTYKPLLEMLYGDWTKGYEQAQEDMDRIQKDMKERTIDILQNQADKNKEVIGQGLKQYKDAIKMYGDWAAKNPLMDALMGDQVWGDIFSGILDPQKLAELTSIWTESLGQIGDAITGVADEWVKATETIVANYDKMISETQNQLQIELQLNQQGFASNVTFEQKKLKELTESRKKAVEDYKKASEAQMAIDAASQVSQLGLAYAKYITTYAEYPFVGVALALAAIASAFGLWQKYRALTKETATMYKEGGVLKGKTHDQGGIYIPELDSEVEGGEYVINRKSTVTYKPVLDVLNKPKLDLEDKEVLIKYLTLFSGVKMKPPEEGEFVVNKQATIKYRRLLEAIDKDDFSDLDRNATIHYKTIFDVIKNNSLVTGGEFIVNKESTIKYKPLLEAINKDDLSSLDRQATIKYKNILENVNLGQDKEIDFKKRVSFEPIMPKGDIRLNSGYIKNLTQYNVNVSLDESKELKAIHKLLQQPKHTIEYHGDYRIERMGNVEKRIKMN